jgi:hypothetical protein
MGAIAAFGFGADTATTDYTPCLEFGIIPLDYADATTDQTAKIVAALNSGKKISFPAGRYNFKNASTNVGIADNASASLFGVPRATKFYNIHSLGRYGRMNWAGRDEIVVQGIDFYVVNLPVQPTNDAAEYDTQLRFTNCSKVTVSDCKFFNHYGTTLLFRSCTDSKMLWLESTGSYKDNFHITGLSKRITRAFCTVINGGDDAFPVVGYAGGGGTLGQPEDIFDFCNQVRGMKFARGFAYVGAKRVRNIGCYVDGLMPSEFPQVADSWNTAKMGSYDGKYVTLSGLYVSSEAGFQSYGNSDIYVEQMTIRNCGSTFLGSIHINTRTGQLTSNINIRDVLVENSAKHGVYASGDAASPVLGVTIENMHIVRTDDPNGVLGTAGAGTTPGGLLEHIRNLKFNGRVEETGGTGLLIGTNIPGHCYVDLTSKNVNVSGAAGNDILYVGPNTTATEIYIDLTVDVQPQINSAGTPYFLDRIVECQSNATRVRRLNVNSAGHNLNKGIVTAMAEQPITAGAGAGWTWTNPNPYPVLVRLDGGSGLTVTRGMVTGIASPVYSSPNTSKNLGYYTVNPGEGIRVTHTTPPTVTYRPCQE